MKNRYMLLLLSVISTVVYAMENKSVVDYKAVHQQLRGFFKSYAIKQLKKYEEEDTIDMNELIKVGDTVTKSKDVTAQLLHSDIKNEHDNRFIHIAVQKKDLTRVEWLLMKGDKNYVYINAAQEYPIDICIKQLQPKDSNDQSEQSMIDSSPKSRQIFDLLISHIAKLSDYDEFKILCLKKIVALKLKHKRCKSNFLIEKELLQSLVPGTLDQQLLVLSTIYKETVDDTDGSTLTHILVEQENPDELYELAKDDQISWMKNAKGRTASDIALARFLEAVEKIAVVGADEESMNKRGCCLYILMHCLRNIDKKKGIAVTPLGNCCDKHVLQ